MNIVNKVTIRHLRQNKRRTLVTVIGTIISVAMVTAVATLAVSFMDLMIRQAIANDGEWHVAYKDVDKAQLAALRNDEETQTVVLSRDRGYAPLEEGQRPNKPYLFIREYNAQGFEQFPIKLSQGRLPQAANEVVVSDEVVSHAGVRYAIGDRLTLDIGERLAAEGENSSQPLLQNTPLHTDEGKVTETFRRHTTATFTVVGFIERPSWEPTWAPGYTVISYVDESMLDADDTVHASVVLHKVRSSLYEHAERVAAANHIGEVEFNNSLLRFYGVTNHDNLRGTLYSLSAIIMAVIIVGSVALIYNAFAISVSERSRHLGMLASVGATKRQKRNSVFFEGVVIGLISIPIGIATGLAGIGVTFLFINSTIQGALGVTETLKVTVTPLSIAAACAISAATIFISTYLPARKASKISAIDAIRQTADIKLTGRAVRTSRLVRALFGIEAEIGLKNLKRNKRRYRVTVFSLVISIVLFLTVSFFTANLQKSLELSQDGVNFDIRVTLDGAMANDELTALVANAEGVEAFTIAQSVHLASRIEQSAAAEPLRRMAEQGRISLEDGKFLYDIALYGLDDPSLQAYAAQIGADVNALRNPRRPSAIVADTVSYQDEGAKKYVETKSVRADIGQSLDLFRQDGAAAKENYAGKVEIAALTDRLPMGILPAPIGGLNVIVSEAVFQRLMEDARVDEFATQVYLQSSSPMATQYAIEQFRENLDVFNVYQARQRAEQMLLIMGVFTYGFIVLISVISIANIFNTISTSVSLRKREFAMLRSVGMTPTGFNKMINYESVFYGVQSLMYGLPLSLAVMFFIHRALDYTFTYPFSLPWASVACAVAAVFVIVVTAMLYSAAKIKRENIIDALKQENI